MANVVLKTEEEQTVQGAWVTPLPLAPAPGGSAVSASVETVETGVAAPIAPFSPASSSRRYDQATIEKALAVAMQMQQEHHATLSTEQAVRLGEEINVDRAFMLKALAQIDGAAAEVTARVAPPLTKAETHASQALAREQAQGLTPLPLISRYIAVIVPLFFALVSFVIFTAPATRLDRSDNTFALLWMFLGGSLLALFLGTGLKRLRLGVLSGFCVGFFLLSAAILSSDNPNSIPVGIFFVMLFLFTATGSMLGVTGAALPRLYRRVVIALVRQFPHLAEEAR